jgi:Protein of unknown function (DUF1664)
MSRGGIGAAVGAAGATAYLRPDLLIEWAQRAATSGAAIGKDTLSSKELDQLSKMVRLESLDMGDEDLTQEGLFWQIYLNSAPANISNESLLLLLQVEQLTREVRSSSNTVTVVHADSSHSLRNTLALYFAMAASAGALYLVVGRGWRLGDLGWVTQRAFRQGMTGLSTGIDSLSARLADVKTRLAARIAEVSQKQDEAATAAAAMRAHLSDVGADVETVRNQVGQLHSTILNMDVEISDIGVNQRHALHGIYILCKAVSELSAGSSIASKTELLEYTQSPVWQRVRPQGLEGILQENSAAIRGGSTNNQESSFGRGGGVASRSAGIFQGDEPWLRQRYMLGTMEGTRGELGHRNANINTNRSEDSSAAFMKALPSKGGDSYRGRDGGGSGSNITFGGGERGGSAGYPSNIGPPPAPLSGGGNYSEIRAGGGGFDRFGGGGSSGGGVATAPDVRREEDRLRNQRQQGFGSDW